MQKPHRSRLPMLLFARGLRTLQCSSCYTQLILKLDQASRGRHHVYLSPQQAA